MMTSQRSLSALAPVALVAPVARGVSIWVSISCLALVATLIEISPNAWGFDLSGDVKLFHTMSGAPRGVEALGGSSSGALTSRLKLKKRGERWRFESHGLLSALGAGSLSTSPLSLSPQVAGLPEALPLTYTLLDDGGAQAVGRIDRLTLSYEWQSWRGRIGRQALSFGQGQVFTPLDRVSPFSPAAIDREYKPGIDAVRLDRFWGVAGEATLVIAQRGPLDSTNPEDDTVVALSIKDSLWGWDVGLLGLWVGGDLVGGVSLAGAVRSVSIYGDLSYTRRATQGALALNDAQRGAEDHFIRATLGGRWGWRAAGGGQLQLEAAWLGDGAKDATEYLTSATDLRVTRGERWLLGRAYASLVGTQAIHPLVNLSLSIISNLIDPSAMVGSSLVWSVSDEVSVVAGGYAGVGEGAQLSTVGGLQLASELGALSWVSFVMMSAYY